ncbi:unnamed protein product [Trifolium pratense]|uniref:Uncharacterized protein n=1 Tax=Trifolium pratense TaxID=57577 RepID=A0ACB0IBY2_TRIPR|nr:unnamed protein product [Trifolium pratense]
MAKKTHSSRQPSSQTPHAKTLPTPPPSKPEPPSQPPPPPSNPSRPNRSKKPTPIAAAAAAAKSSKSHIAFSQNDVILILKALLDFKSQTGNDPDKDFKAFHESLKDSLSIKTTVRKLREKVRVLKLKFDKYCQNNEKDLTFSSSYEKEAFELSQKYWGQEKKVEEKEKQPKKKSLKIVEEKEKQQPKKKIVAKKPAKEESAKGESSGKMGHVNLSESFDFDETCMGLNMLKRGMELLGEEKRKELETRWKKLKVREMEVLVMRAELVKDHARLILNELEG